MKKKNNEKLKNSIQNQYTFRGFTLGEWARASLVFFMLLILTTALFLGLSVLFPALISRLGTTRLNSNEGGPKNSLDFLNDIEKKFNKALSNPLEKDFRKTRDFINEKLKTEPEDLRSSDARKTKKNLKKNILYVKTALNDFHLALFNRGPILMRPIDIGLVSLFLKNVDDYKDCPVLFFDYLIQAAAFIENSPELIQDPLTRQTFSDTKKPTFLNFNQIEEIYKACAQHVRMGLSYEELLTHAFINGPDDAQQISIDFADNYSGVKSPPSYIKLFQFSREQFSKTILRELEKNTSFFFEFLSSPILENNKHRSEIKKHLEKKGEHSSEIQELKITTDRVQQDIISEIKALKNEEPSESKNKKISLLEENLNQQQLNFMAQADELCKKFLKSTANQKIYFLENIAQTKAQNFYIILATNFLILSFLSFLYGSRINLYNSALDKVTETLDKRLSTTLENHQTLPQDSNFIFDPRKIISIEYGVYSIEQIIVGFIFSDKQKALISHFKTLLEKHKKSSFREITLDLLRNNYNDFLSVIFTKNLISVKVKGSGEYLKANEKFIDRKEIFELTKEFFSKVIDSSDDTELSITLKPGSLLRKKEKSSFSENIKKNYLKVPIEKITIQDSIKSLENNFSQISVYFQEKEMIQKSKKRILIVLANLAKFKRHLESDCFSKASSSFKETFNLSIAETIRLAKTILAQNESLLKTEDQIKNVIIQLNSDYSSIKKNLQLLNNPNPNLQLNILLKGKEHFESLEKLKEKIETLKTKDIYSYEKEVEKIEKSLNTLIWDYNQIKQTLTTAKAFTSIEEDEEKNDNEYLTYHTVLGTKDREVSTSVLIKKEEFSLDKETKESTIIENNIAYSTDDDFTNPLPSKEQRLYEGFHKDEFDKKRPHKKKSNIIFSQEKQNNKNFLNKKIALLSQYNERLHALLNLKPKDIGELGKHLSSAILYLLFKLLHALDSIIKFYKENNLQTNLLCFFKNDFLLKRANALRNLLRHTVEHGFSCTFFNDHEKTNVLNQELSKIIEKTTQHIEKIKSNRPSNSNKKIKLDLEALLDCNRGNFSEYIISNEEKDLAKENVNYALSVLASLSNYVFKNPEKKEILMEKDHFTGSIKMMLLLIRDGFKHLKNDQRYEKFKKNLKSSKLQKTTLDVLTDFMAHDAAAEEQADKFFTEDGLDDIVEDISKENMLEVLRSANAYKTCFDQAFNNEHCKEKKTRNINNPQRRQDLPIANINNILSASSFRPTNSKKGNENSDYHFKKQN